MKKFPTKLNIQGQVFKIKYYKKLKEENDEITFGESFLSNNTICIYGTENPEEMVWETILHEIMEILLTLLKLKIKKKHEEFSVFSTALYDTLKRNKLLR